MLPGEAKLSNYDHSHFMSFQVGAQEYLILLSKNNPLSRYIQALRIQRHTWLEVPGKYTTNAFGLTNTHDHFDLSPS